MSSNAHNSHPAVRQEADKVNEEIEAGSRSRNQKKMGVKSRACVSFSAAKRKANSFVSFPACKEMKSSLPVIRKDSSTERE